MTIILNKLLQLQEREEVDKLSLSLELLIWLSLCWMLQRVKSNDNYLRKNWNQLELGLTGDDQIFTLR